MSIWNSVTHYSKITKQNTAISALTFFNKQLYNNPYHDIDLSRHSFLITGGAGFIGSNLVEYLLKYNFKDLIFFTFLKLDLNLKTKKQQEKFVLMEPQKHIKLNF